MLTVMEALFCGKLRSTPVDLQRYHYGPSLIVFKAFCMSAADLKPGHAFDACKLILG